MATVPREQGQVGDTRHGKEQARMRAALLGPGGGRGGASVLAGPSTDGTL